MAVLLPFPTGWVGLATTFSPPPTYECTVAHKQDAKTLTVCSTGSDIPRFVRGLKLLENKIKVAKSREAAWRWCRVVKTIILWLFQLFPSCVFLDVYVCVLLAREDVDSRTAPDKNQGERRTKPWIVGRNSTSAFEGKHGEASTVAYQNTQVQ